MSSIMYRLKPRFKNLMFSSALVRDKSVWTGEKIVNSPYEDVNIPNVTLDQYMFSNLEKWATKTAVVCSLTNRGYTYEQVYKQSRRFAANLRKKLKIKDGDVVAVMIPNVPEFPIITMGVLAAGAVVTTMNPIYTAYEVQRQLLLSEASLIVTNEDIAPTVKEALRLAKQNIPVIVLNITKSLQDGTISYDELVVDVDLSVLNEVKRNYDDIAFLPYSSGTTGLPKGVELTHRNLIANCEQQNTEIRQYVYTTVLFLGTHPQVTAKHLEHVRTITSGAAPLPAVDIQRLLHKAERDIDLCQGYGLTEAAPLVSLQPSGQKTYEDVGYCIPNMQMRIVDSELKNLGPDEVGELLVRGPNVMKGYFKNPEATKATFDGEWLRTGDIGKIDKTGLLTVTDRLKELIKVKGYQVSPAELDNVLKEHPAVLDAAVVGVPDDLAGERPKAYVILKQGVQSTEKEIIDFVKKRVASYKQIKEVIFLDSIPKNVSGKILRKTLKDQYC